VLGAVRAGIREIIVPIDNDADLEDIPDVVREGMTFHLAETLDDVVRVALGDGGSRLQTKSKSTAAGEEPNGRKPGPEKKPQAEKKPAAKGPVAKKKPAKK
jgi:hypothetical protein